MKKPLIDRSLRDRGPTGLVRLGRRTLLCEKRSFTTDINEF